MKQNIIEPIKHPAEERILSESDNYFRTRYKAIYKIASQFDYIEGAKKGYDIAMEQPSSGVSREIVDKLEWPTEDELKIGFEEWKNSGRRFNAWYAGVNWIKQRLNK